MHTVFTGYFSGQHTMAEEIAVDFIWLYLKIITTSKNS